MSLYDLIQEKALGYQVTITFPTTMKIIRFTNKTETTAVVTEQYYTDHITLPMNEEWWITNRSQIYLYIATLDDDWLNTFDELFELDIMVTYGDEPQTYQPYCGDIIHQQNLISSEYLVNAGTAGTFTITDISNFDILILHAKITDDGSWYSATCFVNLVVSDIKNQGNFKISVNGNTTSVSRGMGANFTSTTSVTITAGSLSWFNIIGIKFGG